MFGSTGHSTSAVVFCTDAPRVIPVAPGTNISVCWLYLWSLNPLPFLHSTIFNLPHSPSSKVSESLGLCYGERLEPEKDVT